MDPVTKEVLDSSNIQFNPSELLTKIVAVTGNQTIESNFTYDSKNYLVSEQHKGIENGFAVDTYKKYYRDTTGKILKVAYKSKQDIDTVYTRATYDDYNTNTLLFTLSQYQRQGQAIRDSVIYVFDGNGNIGIQKLYRLKALGDYRLVEQYEYSFSGGNLVVVKNFIDSSNTSNLVVAGVRHFSYDTRFNPLKLKNEAIVMGKPEWASANNLVSIDLDNKLAPGENYKVESKLFYSTSRKPVYGTFTKSPMGRVTHATYFYK